MADRPIRVRAVFGKYEDDSIPVLVGAMDEGTYEVISEDEWDEQTRRWKDAFDPDGMVGYEWREVTVSLPRQPLVDLFAILDVPGSVDAA